MAGPRVSIIIPVFNEAANVEPMVAAIDEAMVDDDWEILFVDDDSPDGTADKVTEVARRDARVRLVLRVSDRGLAKACIQGMLSSTADYLCVIDGDGQHDPKTIARLLAPLQTGEADIVSGARDLNDGGALEGLSSGRRKLSQVGNALCNFAMGREVTDPLTGLFAIRRDAFLRVARRLSDSGFKLLFDILASDHALRHREVGFTFRSRMHGESKLDMLNLWQFFVLLIEKLSRGIVSARFVSFILVGGSGVAVHFAVFLPALAAGISFPVAQTMAAVIAMTSNFLLNNQLTFRDRRLSGFDIVRGWFLFLIISSVGLVANVAVASLTFQQFQGFALLASMTGVIMDAIWKFVVSGQLVWRVAARVKK